LFLSDGGMETSLIYHDGVDLPQFAAFILLRDSIGRRRLADYYGLYLELAAETPHAGFVLETPTWRASADWGTLLGYDELALAEANKDAAALVMELRDEWQSRIAGPVVVSGQIGPRGDGYQGLKALLPELNVLGGCCGTDLRHLRAIRDAWIGTAA
jgi:homocysteine S-methyltransferase